MISEYVFLPSCGLDESFANEMEVDNSMNVDKTGKEKHWKCNPKIVEAISLLESQASQYRFV